MPSAPSLPADSAVSFGPFGLLASRQLLLENDKPVGLGNRVFGMLVALVERANDTGPWLSFKLAPNREG
jgi:DNA-binding winged helix-turn-helix (wHTH) protein